MDARPRTVEALDETLLDAPGARTRRTGAFGGFTTLSLRGADAEQTTVLLGEIPIASPDGSAFDLGTIPHVAALARRDLSRGRADLALGGRRRRRAAPDAARRRRPSHLGLAQLRDVRSRAGPCRGLRRRRPDCTSRARPGSPASADAFRTPTTTVPRSIPATTSCASVRAPTSSRAPR